MRKILKKEIPSTGEKIPAVGLGTYNSFNVSATAQKESLTNVLKEFTSEGSAVIDSSPMYGKSESVVGELSEKSGLNEKLFVATKVWTTGKEEGIEQMEESLRLFRRKQIDLMQIHNLVDWQTHLKTLRQWKDEKRIRYIGLTHYTNSAHSTLRSVIEKEEVDFIQINYSITDRFAEKEILPAALERNVAVLINRPLDVGKLFEKVKGKPVPEWAKEFDCDNWSSFFLKFLLAHPAVTCVIPATGNLQHLKDNLSAGIGRLPDESHKKKMIELIS